MAANLGSLPRCTLLDKGASVGSRRAGRFQLLPGSGEFSFVPFGCRKLVFLFTLELHPRDIGAWIMQETKDGLKTCYQIVAWALPI